MLSLSRADDVSHTRSSAGRARRAYKSASSKCRSGRGWSVPFAGRRRSPPYGSHRNGAACADWRGARMRGSLPQPVARRVDGSGGGHRCPGKAAASCFRRAVFRRTFLWRAGFPSNNFPAVFQIVLQGLLGRNSERNHALLVALAPHQDVSHFEFQVFETRVGHFGNAHASGI